MTWLIDHFFIEQSLLDDPGHSALTVLAMCVHDLLCDSWTLMISLEFDFWHLFLFFSE